MSEDTSEKIKNYAAKKVVHTIQQAFSEVTTPEEAKHLLDEAESKQSRGNSGAEPPAKANLIEQADSISKSKKNKQPVKTIVEVAHQVETASQTSESVLDTAIRKAGMEEVSSKAQRGRKLLRRELVKRLQPLDAADAILFMAVNDLPHPALANSWMKQLTKIMTGGSGWLIILFFSIFYDRARGIRALCRITPSLWIATWLVEYPIKHFFRRRRPFITIVRAVVTGRKPGSYSFPSGHSAAAFAGAALLKKYYPEFSLPFLMIAGSVAFSRVYLGVHYPGDVASGGLIGAFLARIFHKFFSRLH